MPREREEEAVDAGAAIAKGKETSLLVRPVFCRREEARSAESPASSWEAIADVEGAAKADEETAEEEDDDDDDDDEISKGKRDGATVRMIVSRVSMRSCESLSLASKVWRMS